MDSNDLSMVGKRFGDINDLPDVLKKQLNLGQLDDLERKIVQTIEGRFSGIASVDEIIVGLYRDFGFIAEDRRYIANKLYRMTKSNILLSVKKRKGVYELRKSDL